MATETITVGNTSTIPAGVFQQGTSAGSIWVGGAVTQGQQVFSVPSIDLSPTMFAQDYQSTFILKEGLLYEFFCSYPVREIKITEEVRCECGKEMAKAEEYVYIVLYVSGYEGDMWVDHEIDNLSLPGYSCRDCQKSLLRIYGL